MRFPGPRLLRRLPTWLLALLTFASAVTAIYRYPDFQTLVALRLTFILIFGTGVGSWLLLRDSISGWKKRVGLTLVVGLSVACVAAGLGATGSFAASFALAALLFLGAWGWQSFLRDLDRQFEKKGGFRAFLRDWRPDD
jgi:hypothetical protein